MAQKKSRREVESLPSVEQVRRELGKVESIDDFFGKEGIFARLFARTIEEMLEGELSLEFGFLGRGVEKGMTLV